jgi:preprotein translocase subunit SecB
MVSNIKTKQQKLEIQRVYVKNMSLETVNTPQVFQEITAERDWNPDVKVDLKVNHSELENKSCIFDVVLHVDVSVQPKDKKDIFGKNIFHVKIEQAGVFHIAGFDKKDIEYLLDTHCPEILFPYARELVSSIVSRASFPQLNLMPVNFAALYEQPQKI